MKLLVRLKILKRNIVEFSIIFFTIAIIIIWWCLFYPKIGFDSSQWVLSTLIQSLSAILGLLVVLYIFIYSKKCELIGKLSGFEIKYDNMLMSPTEDGIPFIIKYQEKYFDEIKSNTSVDTYYLDQFYSISVLARYMILKHNLKFSTKKIAADIESTGYYKKISRKPYGKYDGIFAMKPDVFFNHIINFPLIAHDELFSKLMAITKEMMSNDNIIAMTFTLKNIEKIINNNFIILIFFIFLNIIGDIMTLSIITNDSFNYVTKILIGISISSGLVTFFVLWYYILHIIKIPAHQN